MKYAEYAVALLCLTAPHFAEADGLTGQHAVYDLTLSKVRTHDITGAVGQMSFNVVDGCTGWATTQHMTLFIRNVDGTLNKSVTNYITWESKDGRTLTFTLSESDNDGKEQIDDAGTATRTGSNGTGVINYTTPANTTFTMPPGTLFPMAHTEALLAAGREGKKFISPPLFDGTTADGTQATFVAILGHHGPGKNNFAALSTIPSTDVDIAFFERKNDDETPDFRTQMRYFEDGVATNLVMDFGDFVMTGKLAKLNIPPSACVSK
jgi:EipB-like